jgi:hypothetical protein
MKHLVMTRSFQKYLRLIVTCFANVYPAKNAEPDFRLK